jgi:hypothetical protein
VLVERDCCSSMISDGVFCCISLLVVFEQMLEEIRRDLFLLVDAD